MHGSFAQRLAILAKGATFGAIDVIAHQTDDGPATYRPVGCVAGESWPEMDEAEFEAFCRTHRIGLIRRYISETRT